VSSYSVWRSDLEEGVFYSGCDERTMTLSFEVVDENSEEPPEVQTLPIVWHDCFCCEAYEVPCSACKGSRKVLTIDRETSNSETLATWDRFVQTMISEFRSQRWWDDERSWYYEPLKGC